MPLFWCLILGDQGVGKTTFIKTFLNADGDNIRGAYYKVELVSNLTRTRDPTISFRCFDAPADKEAFKAADVAIIMFDVTDPTSFDSVIDIRNDLYIQRGKVIPVVFVGNKIDIGNRQVTPNPGEYIDVSALKRTNLLEPFSACTRLLLDKPLVEVEPIKHTIANLMEFQGPDAVPPVAPVIDIHARQLALNRHGITMKNFRATKSLFEQVCAIKDKEIDQLKAETAIKDEENKTLKALLESNAPPSKRKRENEMMDSKKEE